MILEIDPKVDYVFKRLLGREESTPLLIHVLHAVLQLPPGHAIVALDLLNPFQEKDFDADKLSILDIKVRDQAGRLYNVEIQLLIVDAFLARVLYYWSRLYQGQLTEGQDYSALRPTVTIIFANGRLFPELPGWHAVFELRERQAGLLFNEHMQIHVLEIPKFNLTAAELKTPLERWMYFLKHGAELDPDNLPETLRTPEILQAVAEVKKMTQSELERERYESRLKWQRDLATGFKEAEQRGERKGRLLALVHGIHLCQRLLRRPQTPADQLQSLPIEDLQRLNKELENELTRNVTPGG